MKFLCRIGWHNWQHTSTTRKCKCCGKSQHLDEEEAEDFNIRIWIDD